MIDYKELLLKYLAFIQDVEGSSFLLYARSGLTSVSFTQEELDELDRIQELASDRAFERWVSDDPEA